MELSTAITLRRGATLAGGHGQTEAHPPPRVSRRTQCTLIDGLRAVAHRSADRRRRRHFEVLLSRRAAAVRGELLELAALLDITAEPDPAAIDALLGLLTDGRDSPLYNPAIHVSELHATLVDARRRLLRGAH